ncbi:hypothetical protein QDT73_05385 [Acinetobacter baumannii]|nr:hypothetical protein [Acinetobacter baumannii]MDH2566792.1 hypothetical protein [Acinetobacter baumannii]
MSAPLNTICLEVTSIPVKHEFMGLLDVDKYDCSYVSPAPVVTACPETK